MTKNIRLNVEWGYEVHSIEIEKAEWKQVTAGEELSLVSDGYYEGEQFNIYWHFNHDPDDTLIVEYGDDGGTGFIGRIEDAVQSE